MWGETIFGIEEEHYESDYIQELTAKMNQEQPKEEKLQRFKNLFDTWNERIESAKKLMPQFRDDVARRVVNLELAKIEQDLGIFDNMAECDTQSEEYYKIANVFTNLWSKLASAEKKLKTEIFDKLIVFGEQPFSESEKSKLSGGDYEVMIARILPFLREVYDIIEIITLVVMNCILQFQALYSKKSTYLKIFKEFDFFFPIRIIGKGLFLLLCIDNVISETTFYERSFLLSYWGKYKDSFNLMLQDPAKYGLDAEKMKLLKRIVVKVDLGVMKGDTLNTFLTHLAAQKSSAVFEEMTDFNEIKSNKYILEIFKNYFKQAQSTMETILADGQNLNLQENDMLSEYVCVFAFYTKFFNQENKDVWRAIWSLQKKTLMIHIHRFLMIRVCDFLMKYCPPKKMYSSLEPKEINPWTLEFLRKSQETFKSDVISVYKHLCQWSLKMNSMACSMYVFQTAKESDRVKIFDARMSQIRNGILLAKRIRMLFRSNMLIRQKMGYSVDPSLLKNFLLLVEMAKKMMELIEQKDIQLMQDVMVRFSSLRVAKGMRELTTRFSNQKMSDKTFLIEPFKSMFHLCNRFPTEQREHLLNFSMSFIGYKNIIKEPEIVQFKHYLGDLQALANYKNIFRELLDCSFLYWYKEFIPDMLEIKTTGDGEYFRLQLFMNAIGDCKVMLLQAVHLQENKQLLEKFQEYVLECLSKKVISKAAVKLEEDLVIQTHHFYSISDLMKPDPQSGYQGDLKTFLDIKKLVVLDKIVDMKYLIEASLSESLYNRISDNQKNFDTYEIMRTLARVKYDIDIGHSYIPSKTIEQGRTDILAILRSLPFFIQNFKYNMFNQTFIETLNESTRLKAVSINLISDSIKTHGLGVIKSSISLLSEFIHKQINSFIVMMSNDTLNSLLVRESRWLRKNKEKNTAEDRELRYDFKRALSFVEEFSQAVQTSQGMRKLEEFRLLITFIGNCIAFVRILRTASFNYLSKNIEFIPYIEEITASFADTCQILEFKSKTLFECCKDTDAFLDMMKDKFKETPDKKEETDYLRGLAKRYQGKLQGENFVKLQFFYMLVPALTLDYIQSLLIAKEKLLKKNFKGGYISDDGFIVGLAYLTEILNQSKNFEETLWFEEVKEKVSTEVKELEEKFQRLEEEKKVKEKAKESQKDKYKDDESIELGPYLRMRKSFLEEFVLLENGYMAAHILFKLSEVKEENFFANK
jgi:WASH complex subunit 7